MERNRASGSQRRPKLVVMKRWHYGFRILIWAMFAPTLCWAQAGLVDINGTADGDNIINLFGAACEEIHSGEAKSSVRVRATDKASYKAVETIPELSDYRSGFSAHDFNVLIYHIIDNYLEDMAIKTASQDDKQICVEITAYLNSENILKAINDNFNKFGKDSTDTAEEADIVNEVQNTYPDALVIENDKQLVPQVTDFPPAPQIVLKDEIRAENLTAESQENIDADIVDNNGEHNTRVFINRTKFFNGMTTNAYFKEFAQMVKQKSGVTIVTDKNKADYIINPEVLRAKVDPINKQTNRLQMVVSLELFDVNKKTSVREHQNRFILFESTEDEQTVAGNLMKKLFAKAGEIIVGRISTKPTGALMERDAIITPSQPKRVNLP